MKYKANRISHSQEVRKYEENKGYFRIKFLNKLNGCSACDYIPNVNKIMEEKMVFKWSCSKEMAYHISIIIINLSQIIYPSINDANKAKENLLNANSETSLYKKT